MLTIQTGENYYQSVTDQVPGTLVTPMPGTWGAE